MTESSEQTYMTVGELAEKVGVTVRTIQYYDQENLLKPSAKGNRNQRLYTQKDEETLYKILCFKFMGLSITDIRQNLNSFEENQSVALLLDKKINDVEKEMSALMKRFATLKNLRETVKSNSDVNWQYYAHVVERFQDEGKYLWQLNCSFEENAYREHENEQRKQQFDQMKQKEAMEDFHQLIAEAIRLIHQNEPRNSKKTQEIARRYMEMSPRIGFHSCNNKLHDVIISDSADSGNVYDSFHELRREVSDFLQEAVMVYQELHKSDIKIEFYKNTNYKENEQNDCIMDDNEQM